MDLSDRTYYIPCFSDLGLLIRSIKAVGVLSRPFVQRKDHRVFRPVLGRRRFEAAISLGIKEIETRVISAQMPEPFGFLLAFWDNLSVRLFEEPTKAIVVNRLLELFPRDEVIMEYLPLLGIPAQGLRLERLRALASLEDYILSTLVKGQIWEKTAILIAGLDATDRKACMELIKDLGMNANKNAEIISTLFDLSIIQGSSLSRIMAAPEVADILNTPETARHERADRIRKLFRSWKFPELVQEEKNFTSWLRTLGLPPQVRLLQTTAFENDEYRIELRVNSKEEAQSMIQVILNRMA